ncbi:hypothetical protein [uncultured Tateyamaria sp.]|uniref:hypothetical protein n=1 Tax=uncultured Tateyamaria sp. TaxID=455651 RepID=UPI00261051FE|nr:hypothetical protein [uncultured Tateyamaria sp.]
MSLDASTLPINPFLLITTAAYAGASALITGPEIIHRELANSGWQQTCQSELIARSRQGVPHVPDVGGLVCGLFPDLGDLCEMIPDPNAMMRSNADQASQMASDSVSACACAQDVLVQDKRISVAIYAASGRLVATPALRNRETGLVRALHSPACKREG